MRQVCVPTIAHWALKCGNYLLLDSQNEFIQPQWSQCKSISNIPRVLSGVLSGKNEVHICTLGLLRGNERNLIYFCF